MKQSHMVATRLAYLMIFMGTVNIVLYTGQQSPISALVQVAFTNACAFILIACSRMASAWFEAALAWRWAHEAMKINLEQKRAEADELRDLYHTTLAQNKSLQRTLEELVKPISKPV